MKIWDLKTQKCDLILKGHTDLITGIVVLDDQRIMSSSEDCSIMMWDSMTGKCENY